LFADALIAIKKMRYFQTNLKKSTRVPDAARRLILLNVLLRREIKDVFDKAQGARHRAQGIKIVLLHYKNIAKQKSKRFHSICKEGI
jgi:hypothetical protein